MNGSPSRSLIAAAAAFTIALFLFGSALVAALRTEPVSPGPATLPADAPADSAGDVPLSMDALLLAVESDPFRPERQRVEERYRLPGDIEPELPPPPEPPPPPPDFRLAGTMLAGEGGSALIGVGDAPPRFMAVGESMLGFRLERVTPQSATLTGDQGEITLQIPAPAQQIAARPQPGPRGRTPARGGPVQQNRDNAAAAQQLLQRAREAGATPQMLESIMRMIERNGIGSIENMEVGPGTFTIRSRNAPPAPVPADTAMAPAPTRRVPDPD